jgi:serine phosphatase RsbU (regulator of sigma subunit)
MLRVPFLSLLRKAKPLGHSTASHASSQRPRIASAEGTADQDSDRPGCVEILGGNVWVTKYRLLAGLEILLIARPVGAGGGGDIYCIHACEHGALVKFVLLDLTGHGQERDTIAQAVHRLLHRFGKETQPARLLDLLNQQYDHFALPAIYATAVTAVYEPGRKEFRFANAGQPRPYHWSTGECRWTIVQPAEESDCGLPLGVKTEACYAEESIVLDSGDLLLLSSDALSETRNRHDEFLEPEGVLRLLEESSAEIPRDAALVKFAEAFLRHLEEYCGGKAFDDDLTLLWLRRFPTSGAQGLSKQEHLIGAQRFR